MESRKIGVWLFVYAKSRKNKLEEGRWTGKI
jgi:hypothetical protein